MDHILHPDRKVLVIHSLLCFENATDKSIEITLFPNQTVISQYANKTLTCEPSSKTFLPFDALSKLLKFKFVGELEEPSKLITIS